MRHIGWQGVSCTIPVPFKLVHMAVHIHMLQLPDTHNARAIMVGVIPQVARYSIRRAYHTPVSIRLRHRIFTRSVCPDPFRSSVHTGGETFQGIFHPTVHPVICLWIGTLLVVASPGNSHDRQKKVAILYSNCFTSCNCYPHCVYYIYPLR